MTWDLDSNVKLKTRENPKNKSFQVRDNAFSHLFKFTAGSKH